ncbi:MAG: shikimate kinase [Thalassobaculaceae bacterium]
MTAKRQATAAGPAAPRPRPRAHRSVALIGLMGAGKSAVGRRLAKRLARAFTDADQEIEKAAGCSIAEFFERYGEAEFRRGEERVIARLLEGPPLVLATGGGAYMSAVTRANLAARAVTVWLRADLEVLFERVARRSHRPLLNTPDPRATLKSLMDQRYPVYGMADIVVESADVAVEETTLAVERALSDFWHTPKTMRGMKRS